ncbi:hypothetical protein EJ02DRAFT_415519 [Clathrospora elynae]|uniref:WD40 repeat-like protein n=1 Tax=Clathrospora elynae TaxID=706981 RepID=A0A6A5S7M1_9PLEO|nr:hypothetical protein EJ02DRAFT_415519 [Clathrospora elynae]
MMSSTSGSLYPSAYRPSLAVETPQIFTASPGRHSKTRLKGSGQRFLSRTHNIATSISPSGWVAACSPKRVRLYNVKNANQAEDIPLCVELTIPLQKVEKIRGVALTENLLAVITHMQLLVYEEYSGGTPNLVKAQRIDQDEFWIPRSVSISQNGLPLKDKIATASVLVGGEGQSGVKLFRYQYIQCWNVENHSTILSCPRNTGAIKIVGFSPRRSNARYGPMAFALSTGNHLYCWNVDQNSRPGWTTRLDPSWHVDCNSSSRERAFHDEITNATFVICPKGRPHILCTVDHKPGSHLPLTFIVPVDLEHDPQTIRQQISPISDSVIGQSVLAGTASCNGRFLVVLEKGHDGYNMKLLAFRGAPMGRLTCSATGASSWPVKLRVINTLATTISISIEEQNAALEIIAIDGQGHVACSRISVPEMLKDQSPSPPIHEMPIELPVLD